MAKDNIEEILAAPFEIGEVKFKPQTINGSRALVVAFVDARVVMDRLDDVFGVMGWQDSYESLPDGSVVCRLRVKHGDEWIAKEDVGSQSEQPDEGDRRKAAFSDALKRAAVKFGIGRYLYRLPTQWVDYDPQKKKLAKIPTLPNWALPKQSGQQQQVQAKSTQPATTAKPQAKKSPKLLSERVTAFEERLTKEGLCGTNDLFIDVMKKLGKKYANDMDKWPSEATSEVEAICREFEQGRRSNCGAQKA